MKPIGGELALNSLVEDLFFTDSGRSSLRLFIRSGNKDKKFLIPDFLCQIIEDVLIQEKVTYEFYKINSDLSINVNSIFNKEYDVFYLINYFGEFQNIDNLDINDKIVIEDNVFFYDFKNHNNFKKWFAFNSFRKVTPFPDGSLIKSNIFIDKSQINSQESSFCQKKYVAKELKFGYLNNKIDIYESDYLKYFEEGESILNKQNDIFSISNRTIFHLANYNFQKILEETKNNFDFLHRNLSDFWLNKSLVEYNFFVMKVENRDLLRKYLFSKNIFLPIHWSDFSSKNGLSNEVISIPMFSNYNINEMVYIVQNIREFYGIN
jgi:hypothetical protein